MTTIRKISLRTAALVLVLAILSFLPEASRAKTVTAASDVDELLDLPIEDLFNVSITTASKISESVDVAPATVYVITQEQIERLGLRDLKDILALVPGVDTVDPHFFLEGGQRGFMGPFSQSLILINGREMNNLIAGETFISNQFRSRNIKQVEIIAGPGSALYGANAVAGVINIITKTEEDVDGVEVSLSYGSFSTKEANILFGKQEGDFKIYGSVSLYRSEGEDFSRFLSDTSKASPAAENNAYRHLPDSYGYNNESEAIPVSLYVENKNFYAGVDYYRNTSGRGTAGIQWDYNKSEDYREMLLTYGGYKRQDLLDGKLDLKLEYRYYWEKFWGNHTESEGPLENPYTGETNITVEGISEVDAFRGFYSNKRSEGSSRHEVNYETTYRLDERHTLIAGVDFETADIIGAPWSRTEKPHPKPGEFQKLPEFSNYKWGVYAQDQSRLLDDRLILTVGARYDKHERYGDTFNPRGGLAYRATDKTIFKFLYGESFREPNVFELGTAEDTEGNAAPMEVKTYELGWHQYLGRHLKNEAVLFRNKAENLIFADTTFGGYANGGELVSEGFEDQVNFQYGKLKGFLNYTYTTAEQEDPAGKQTEVYDIPRHKANLAAMYDFGGRYSAGFVARYRGEVETEYHDEIYEIDDYIACDLTFNVYDLPWFETEARLDLIAKNIFDETYYHPEPREPTALQHPQEGQSVFVTLTLDI
ncbi:MAG: TonB-dependent receptor [Verrucomicrobia bacterium]|nr:TonB-dependent receptor [Verrucomicrobiota bacterium]